MRFCVAALVLILCLQMPVFAWQFYDGSDIAALEPGYALLEPDNWNREDLYAMRQKGITTLAWLNLSQIEENRLIPLDIKDKDYVISGRYLPEGKKLAVFYSQSFRDLLRLRLREYLLKGFAGVVFAKVGYYDKLSNSPINRSEMWRLVTDLAVEARRLSSSALVVVHDASCFFDEIRQTPIISGVVEEGLYFGKQGRQVRAWDREKRLNTLIKLKENDKLILLAEDARTEKRRQFSSSESQKHGFDSAFAQLPMIIERKVTDGSKK